VLDLGGNVAEWVQDRFSDHYSDCGSCKNPLNDEAPGDAGSPTAQGKKAGKAGKRGKGKGEAATLRVVRGGHLDLPADGCRSAGRSRLGEDQMTFRLGFRCVRSLSE
jgi:formylglycine-generating enzyme required for sulfatase activity